jgi:hypothetical protein
MRAQGAQAPEAQPRRREREHRAGTRRDAQASSAPTSVDASSHRETSNAAAGHGNDTALDERIAEKVDIYAFMLTQLGVNVRSADAPPNHTRGQQHIPLASRQLSGHDVSWSSPM